MIVAIHQPQYLPWLPYCAKASSCDVFVYLDSVQFQKNGVQNRNQIKSNQGALWLTVPVNASLEQTILNTRIADQSWAKKHIKSIQQNYAKAPSFELFANHLEPILQRPWENVADLNIAITEWMFSTLGINCRRIRASELNVGGAKDDLVINICKVLGGDKYLSGQGARNYQNADKFHAEGIALDYHSYHNPVYSQCHTGLGFVADLSAIDLIFNEGSAAREIMLSGDNLPSTQN